MYCVAVVVYARALHGERSTVAADAELLELLSTVQELSARVDLLDVETQVRLLCSTSMGPDTVATSEQWARTLQAARASLIMAEEELMQVLCLTASPMVPAFLGFAPPSSVSPVFISLSRRFCLRSLALAGCEQAADGCGVVWAVLQTQSPHDF
jgi:hypothetical protein